MTREQYSLAFDNGFKLTVRFLVSRGLSGDSAEEAAQAAWAKGGSSDSPWKVAALA